MQTLKAFVLAGVILSGVIWYQTDVYFEATAGSSAWQSDTVFNVD